MSASRASRGEFSASTAPAHADAPLARTIAEVVDTIVARFDTDADAAITPTEVLAVVDPDGTRTTVAAEVADIFTQTDTNTDQSLSKDELTVAVTALDTDGSGTLDRSDHPADAQTGAATNPLGLLLHGHHGGGLGGVEGHAGRGGPAGAQGGGHGPHGGLRAPATIEEMVDQIFTVYDTDTSTPLLLSEVLAVLDPAGTRTLLAAEITAGFAELDLTGDGLSESEITAFFTALDTDASGSIEYAERPDPAGDDAGVELIGILLHVPPAPDFGC